MPASEGNSDLSVTFVQTVEKNQIPYDPAPSDATVSQEYVTMPGRSLPPHPPPPKGHI